MLSIPKEDFMKIQGSGVKVEDAYNEMKRFIPTSPSLRRCVDWGRQIEVLIGGMTRNAPKTGLIDNVHDCS